MLALSAFIACFSIPVPAHEVNTQGRDFWVSFLPNWPGAVPKLEILVAGEKPCSGVVSNPRTGWSARFSVTPGMVTSVVIPNSEGLMEKENKVEHKALHITTTEDVSLYASNFYTATYDVSNVLPTAILTGNYIAQAFSSGMSSSQSDLSSKMLIVAIENDTQIKIDAKGGLKGTLSSKREITLNAGECYLCISARGDITGTAVNVKNGKKVAVFSGGDTQIPADGCCYDAVFEQSIPLAYWGRHFVVTASKERKNDIVRITALSPGCRISIDGRHRATIGARQHFDYKLNGVKNEAVYISTSSPVSVAVFLTSATMGGEMGDPSMVNINPIEQQMDKVTFATYNTAVSRFHVVNIVTQTSQVQHLTLDGMSIGSEFKPVPKKRELSYARVNVEHGSHTLESSEGGFVAHIYGLGSYESYAYSAGSNTRVLNQFDEEGNLILSDIPEEEEGKEETVGSDDGDDQAVQPAYSHTDTLSAVGLEPITLSEIKRGVRIRGLIEDPEGHILDPAQFYITTESDNDILIKDFKVTFERDTVSLEPHLRGAWCDCFIPDRVRVDVILTPKDEGNDRVVITIYQPITKDASWIGRCLWALILMGTLILLIVYLLALLKKKRFKKTAEVVPVYYNRYGEEIDDGAGQRLRRKGLLAWACRWLIPGTEKRTLSFSDPNCVLTFIASESADVVEIPKKCISSATMDVEGFDPKNDPNPSLPVRIGPEGRIEILRPNGKREGYLYFHPGDSKDGGGYRLLLIILLFAAILAIIVLAFLMIKGLF